MTEDDRTAELRRRATRLAEPPAPPAPTDDLDALAFTWAGSRYLVPVAHVRETVRAGRLIRLPAAQPPLIGACTVRSQAVPVLDLRPLVDLPFDARPVPRLVVLGDGERPSLALAADEVERIVTLPATDLHDPAGRHAMVRAVTGGGASLLDTHQLLDLPAFFRTTEGTHP